MAKPRKCAAASASASASASATSLKFTPFPELDSHLFVVKKLVDTKIASIRNLSIAPDASEILSEHIGVGICIDPKFVLTSARVVGQIADVAATGNPPLYKAYIGCNAALLYGPLRSVKLTPVAVSFARDLAVLKLVEPEGEGTPLPVCAVATSTPEKESILMAISYGRPYGWWLSLANVRSVGAKTIKAKAPWPLDDGLPWMEYDDSMFYRGPPPPTSVLFGCEEKVTGSISGISGSPWFNLYGELVGIASWQFIDNPANFSVGFVVPVSNFSPVVDYAKTKGLEDPVVMDDWIDSEVIHGGDNPIDGEVIAGDNPIESEVIGGGQEAG